MQSPKFKFLQDDLNMTFSPERLREEWKKRVGYQIRKQRVVDPIEYRDYKEGISDLVSDIRHEILAGKYETRPAKRYLIEKSRGLCRQMTLVHPRDLLVLERLARTLYFDITASAPSKSAFFEPDDGNFKSGFSRSDIQYGSFASWKKFQQAIFGFARENKYIVISDVANFYDFINFKHLRNIVSSASTVREPILDLLIFILNRLTWTPDFMPLTEVGMPQIETTATRVLANALLFELDKVAEDRSIENYARFMDDIDVGVETIANAKKLVRDLDLTLQSRQLRLNSSKTKILSQQEAFEHFRISENEELARIEAWQKTFGAHRLVKAIAKSRYEKWMDRDKKSAPGQNSRFHGGNGPKIHKWILGIVHQLGERVPAEDLHWLIRNEPGMRSTAFRYLSLSTKGNSNTHTLLRVVNDGRFVDDAAFIDLSGYLMHGRFRATNRQEENVSSMVYYMEQGSDIRLHSSILVAARFFSNADLLDLLKRNRDRIKSDYWLARVSGGVAPRFLSDTSKLSEYTNFIRSLGNDEAERVLAYHLNIAETKAVSGSLKSYLTAQNKTFPQKIYFPKVLSALSLSKNPDQTALMSEIHKRHPALKGDPYYSKMGF